MIQLLIDCFIFPYEYESNQKFELYNDHIETEWERLNDTLRLIQISFVFETEIDADNILSKNLTSGFG